MKAASQSPMLIPKYKPTNRTNVPKAESWIDDFMLPVNEQLKRITTATERMLSMADNMNSEIRELGIMHDTSTDISLKRLRGIPKDVFLTYWDYNCYAKFKWSLVDTQTIRIKVFFDTTPAPTSEVTVRILVLGD